MSIAGTKIICSYEISKKPFYLRSAQPFEEEFLPQLKARFAIPFEPSDINVSYADPDTNERMYITCNEDFDIFVLEAQKTTKILELSIEIEENAKFNAKSKETQNIFRSSIGSVGANPVQAQIQPPAQADYDKTFMSMSTVHSASNISPTNSLSRGNSSPSISQIFTMDSAARSSNADILNSRNLFKSAVASGDYGKIVLYGQKLAQANAASPEVLYNLAIAQSSLGQHADSIPTWSKYIEIKPNHAQAYQNRANSYLAMGNSGPALEDFELLVQLEPNSALFHHNLAVAAASLGSFARAVAAQSLAIQLIEQGLSNPKEFSLFELYYNRGICQKKLANATAALNDFSRAINLNGHSAESYFARAGIYKTLGEFDLAIADYNKAAALPNFASFSLNYAVLSDLAASYYGKSALPDAIEAATRSVALRANFSAYFHRSVALAEQGKLQESLADIEKALELEPNNQTLLSNKQIISAALGT
jgi:tetratricopeptide (TPR) repeat protein